MWHVCMRLCGVCACTWCVYICVCVCVRVCGVHICVECVCARGVCVLCVCEDCMFVWSVSMHVVCVCVCVHIVGGGGVRTKTSLV